MNWWCRRQCRKLVDLLKNEKLVVVVAATPLWGETLSRSALVVAKWINGKSEEDGSWSYCQLMSVPRRQSLTAQWARDLVVIGRLVWLLFCASFGPDLW